MIEYSMEMQILSKRSDPSEREIELYKAVCYLGESFQTKQIRITSNDGSDNEIFNVYYEGRNVFNISRGVSDKIRLYFAGEWEDAVLKRYHDFR